MLFPNNTSSFHVKSSFCKDFLTQKILTNSSTLPDFVLIHKLVFVFSHLSRENSKHTEIEIIWCAGALEQNQRRPAITSLGGEHYFYPEPFSQKLISWHKAFFAFFNSRLLTSNKATKLSLYCNKPKIKEGNSNSFFKVF